MFNYLSAISLQNLAHVLKTDSFFVHLIRMHPSQQIFISSWGNPTLRDTTPVCHPTSGDKASPLTVLRHTYFTLMDVHRGGDQYWEGDEFVPRLHVGKERNTCGMDTIRPTRRFTLMCVCLSHVGDASSCTQTTPREHSLEGSVHSLSNGCLYMCV